ncbi:MAG: hypothetical protein HC862_23620 [Scytonema sp. RU_4_4]|nr:hypothetical protein [Scytonema sp. RU_4_4]
MLQVGKAAQRRGSPPAVLAPQRTGSARRWLVHLRFLNSLMYYTQMQTAIFISIITA